MVKRQRQGNYYVSRTRDGRYKKYTRVGRSLAADRRRRATTTVRPGYGNRGDIRRSASFRDFIRL